MGVLQNRLNDAVLEVLTTMLYRNPACRLYPDDVRFIQPVGGDINFTSQVIYSTTQYAFVNITIIF